MSKNMILYLIDAHSYIYRAYHAIRALSTSYGLPTQAVFGVTNMLLKVLREKKPEYLAMVFDTKGPTFRHLLLDSYKANRPSMPDDLSVQVPYIKEMIRGINLPAVELEGFEADDVIATIVTRLASECLQIVIVTSDKDLVQLVSPFTTIWDPMKSDHLDLVTLRERYGLDPEQMIDVMSLTGDVADNIPGIPGIGPKTALGLIQKYKSLENLFGCLDEIGKPKLRQNLISYKDQALLARQLVRLREDLPLEIDLSKFKINPPNKADLQQLFKKLEFSKFLNDFEQIFGELFKQDSYPQPLGITQEETCSVIRQPDELEKLLTRTKESGAFGIITMGTHPDPIQADLLGFTFITGKYSELETEAEEAYHIPLSSTVHKLPVLMSLASVLENPSYKKTGYDLKYDLILLKKNDMGLAPPYNDLMIAGYLLNPISRVTLKSLAEDYLGLHYEKKEGLQCIHNHNAVSGCAAVKLTARLEPLLLEKLKEKGLFELFCQVEMPLIEVLAEIEITGMKINVPFLSRMSEELEIQLAEIRKNIVSLAGCDFNLNSHQQLSAILFDKLSLPRMRKTKKNGSFSTDAGILTELSLYHPLPAQILAYRNLAKLKSTYVDVLPRLVSHHTGRLHSSYHQAITATGRLSCSEPNIQNIPIRSDEGRRIRAAFITDPGWILISFDYSQIELRILAHFSQDESLIKAFEKGEDVHTVTAADIFNTFPQMVTPEMRRVAKTINFGVAYGMSSFGLSQELRIGRKEAQNFIDAYFVKFRNVKKFMETAIDSARKAGCARTLLNRYRPIPDIDHSNNNIRQFAERTAINTPIQGTAADIIKVAMVRVYSALKSNSCRARIIMQVHDELIIEAPNEENDIVTPLIKAEMEGAVNLSVPLVVNVRSGLNWSALE